MIVRLNVSDYRRWDPLHQIGTLSEMTEQKKAAVMPEKINDLSGLRNGMRIPLYSTPNTKYPTVH